MIPREILKKVKKEGRNVLTVDEALKVIKFYKIPVADFQLARNCEEAIEIANKIGYPVAMKVVSPSILHKSDVGGIALNIKNRQELQNAYRGVVNNARKISEKVDGILVQKMVSNGQELIIGGKKDEQFGQCIIFGMGGILAEVYKDTSLRVLPISKKDAEEMVKEIKGYKILKGFRGKSYDTDALIDILLKTSKLLEENPEIRELDINPVIVLQKGAVAVDARIVVD